MPKRALGIEQSWEELQRDLGRTGPGCSDALYFKSVSTQGPQLFAVVNDNSVFYHDNGQWYQYITAYDIKLGAMESNNSNVSRAVNGETKTKKAIEETNWVIVSRDK
jgi:hypothetical protein